MEKTVAAPRRPGEDPSCRRGAAENRLRGGVKSPFYTNVEFSNFKKNQTNFKVSKTNLKFYHL